MQCATKLISSPHPGERRRLDPMPISSVSPNISPLHPSDASLLFYLTWNICLCSQNYDRQVKDTDNFLYLWRWEQHYKWGLGGFWFNGVLAFLAFVVCSIFPFLPHVQQYFLLLFPPANPPLFLPTCKLEREQQRGGCCWQLHEPNCLLPQWDTYHLDDDDDGGDGGVHCGDGDDDVDGDFGDDDVCNYKALIVSSLNRTRTTLDTGITPKMAKHQLPEKRWQKLSLTLTLLLIRISLIAYLERGKDIKAVALDYDIFLGASPVID